MNYNLVPPNSTKADAATLLYPNVPFDTALPQRWVDATLAETGFDVRPHFVWAYPPNSCLGEPYPLTQAGHNWLREHC